MSERREIQVTEAEWEILLALWTLESELGADSDSGFAAKVIIERVQSAIDWNHRTIRTLISRLVEKRAIDSKAAGNKHLYRAAVSKEDCVRVAAQSFSEKFFGGSVKSMLLHFVESGDLTDSDIADIRRSLSEKKKNSSRRKKRS